MARIKFTASAAGIILKAFNLQLDPMGYIVDEVGVYILTPEGDKLTINTFGGISRDKDNNMIFLKNDLLTAIKLVEGTYKTDLEIGDVVRPKPNSKFELRSGSSFYSYAIVISLYPFILVSDSTDMRWEDTIKPSDFVAINKISFDELKTYMKRLKN